MEKIETKKAKKPPFLHVPKENLSDRFSTMTPSDLSNYLQIKRQKQGSMKK